jgi:hypothetical protein
VGSLAQSDEKLWICVTIHEHEVEGRCMALFKTYVIGIQILDSDRPQPSVFDICESFRHSQLMACYWDRLRRAITRRLQASNAAFNKIGLGVNRHGSHYEPLSFSLIPAQCESFQAYNEAYRAIKSAARYLIRLKLCARPDCAACCCIQEVRENPKVVAATSTEAYIKDKKLPIAVALGDNSAVWQKFARETLDLESNVCQSQLDACYRHGSQQRFTQEVL